MTGRPSDFPLVGTAPQLEATVASHRSRDARRAVRFAPNFGGLRRNPSWITGCHVWERIHCGVSESPSRVGEVDDTAPLGEAPDQAGESPTPLSRDGITPIRNALN